MTQPGTSATPAAPAAPPASPAPADPTQTAPQPTTPATPAVDPVPAPEPTPAPASPEPAPEQIGVDPEPKDEPNGFKYQETGDAGLDLALDFIGKLGLGPDHDAVKAATEGNFDKLEATLAAMGDNAKGYEPYVKLAKDAYERTSNETRRTQAAVTAACHDAAGGAEQWAAIKDWAGKNADPDEKAEINAMLSAGPIQARAAVQMLKALYSEAGGTVVAPESVTQQNAGNGNTGNGALSKSEYASELRALRAKLGTRMEGSQEYQSLRARRAAWRG